MTRASIAFLVAIVSAAATAPPASATIALVQKSPEASGGGASITVTLPGATTAGDLLVATVQDLNSNCSTDTFSAPAGWAKAAHVCRTGTNGPLELWYDANVSSGITSITFNTGSSGANAVAQVSEWSGAATTSALDQTGTAGSSSSSTSLPVTTTGNLAASGELAVTSFDTSSGLSSFTPGAGWTNLRTDPGNGFAVDFEVGPASGATLTETMTSNPQTTYGAVIATFKSAACSGASLTVKAPNTLSFPSLTLNGYTASVTTSLATTPDDETGTGSGWNLNATSTTLTTGTYSLPTTATTITAASTSTATGNCSLPTSSVGYPITLPAGSSPPTAAELFNAASSTGKGPVNVTFTGSIAVPGNAHAGSYSSTWTLTMATGP